MTPACSSPCKHEVFKFPLHFESWVRSFRILGNHVNHIKIIPSKAKGPQHHSTGSFPTPPIHEPRTGPRAHELQTASDAPRSDLAPCPARKVKPILGSRIASAINRVPLQGRLRRSLHEPRHPRLPELRANCMHRSWHDLVPWLPYYIICKKHD